MSSAPVDPKLLEELRKLQESAIVVRYDIGGVYGEIRRAVRQ